MKLNTDQLIELFDAAKTDQKIYKSWRFGQAVFNRGIKSHRAIFDEICGTDADPFYNDSIIPAMVEAICDEEAIKYFHEHINEKT